ncbi:B12-binding domain-containing radical SAM protein [Flammeovirga pacifica]|uniref:Coproporphyrinogen III oxidase n=1 Tax=Flammeovirga pacifica TaxID=915059 RepID=A0A1S1Z5A1_FLAPC|nr:radical SAM protein [Flammeovirga pacifica]OHX68333.1 coproporphyrinogen III oxidase [Flammeovirga pacifica]
MHYEGKIYRPWIESESLLIQTTIGCTHNTCTFCDMFREKKFRKRKLEDVLADIEEARTLYPYVGSIFLTDGNVMVLKTDYLLKVIQKIKETFPELTKISLYSSYNDLNRKSVEELKILKEAGLTMAYIGLESGDQHTLDFVEKGLDHDEIINGARKAKEAGIRTLASFIFGLGGKARSQEHIKATTDLLNIIQPEEIAPMALALQPGTTLEQQAKDGEFIQASPLQILEEEKYLIENMTFDTMYWGDHGNNITPMKGMFMESKDRFLTYLEHARNNHPEIHQETLRTFAW